MRFRLKIVGHVVGGRDPHAVVRMTAKSDPWMRPAPVLLRFVMAAFATGAIMNHQDFDAAIAAPRTLFAFAALRDCVFAGHS